MGPALQKKGGNKNASQRGLHTPNPNAAPGSLRASTDVLSTVGSSHTAVTDQEGSRISGEGWNLKRYQREDEDLWGHDVPGPGQRIMDAISKASSSAGRYLEGRISRGFGSMEDEVPASNHYFLPRNPPVNDLHPPVVSTTPSSREETRWMLQPPPPAKVMEGKERVNRSRAGSNGSGGGRPEGIPLSRQVTERLVDARLQRGEMPQPSPSKFPSALSNRSISSAGTDSSFKAPPSRERKPRNRRRRSVGSYPGSTDSEDEGLAGGAGSKKTKRPPQLSRMASNIDNRSSSLDTVEHNTMPSSQFDRSTSIPSQRQPEKSSSAATDNTIRPSLSTIISSSNTTSKVPHKTFSRDHSSSETQSRLLPDVNAMPMRSMGVLKSGLLGPGHERDQENSDPGVGATHDL